MIRVLTITNDTDYDYSQHDRDTHDSEDSPLIRGKLGSNGTKNIGLDRGLESNSVIKLIEIINLIRLTRRNDSTTYST